MYAKWHRIWWRRPVAMETLHSFKASAPLPPERKKDSSRQLPNIRARAFRFARLRVKQGVFWLGGCKARSGVCVLRWCQNTLKFQVFDIGTFGYFWYLLSIDDCAISFGKLRKQRLVHFRHWVEPENKWVSYIWESPFPKGLLQIPYPGSPDTMFIGWFTNNNVLQ